MKKSREQAAQDNRAIQLNTEHPTYHRSRGLDPKAAELAAREARRQAPPSSSSPEASPSSTSTRARTQR